MRADDFLDSNNSANDFLDGVEPKNEPVLKDQVYTALNKLFRSEESSVMDGYQGKGVYDPVARQKLNEEIKRLQQSQAIALPDGPRQVSGGVGIAEKAVRGGVGSLAKSGIGIAQLLADAFQANGASQFMQSAGRRATDFQNGVALDKSRIDGFAHNSIVQDLPNAAASAGSSIISNVPALLASIATANPSVGLGVMFGQSAGQEYGEGRTGGLGSLGALLRAVPMGAAEVIGEKVGGFGQLTHGLRTAIKGGAPERVLRQVGGASLRDIPGEELTTAMQFGVDKLPGIGTNQEAGLKDYLQQARDTALSTMIQGGTMTGGAMAVNKAARRGMPVVENGIAPGALEQTPQLTPQNMSAEAFLNDGAPVSAPDRTGEIKRLIEETANIASHHDVPGNSLAPVEQLEQNQGEVAEVVQTPIEIRTNPANPVVEQTAIQNRQTNQAFQVPVAIRENAIQIDTPTPGLRPGDIVLATGAPFNNQSAARAAARDAGKGWRVSPGGGGFVVRYQPATESQVRQQAVIDTDTDSMFAAIAKLGGISAEQVKSGWGIDPADIRGLYGAGIRRVVTRRGLSLDEMGNRLAEYGYLSRDQHGKFDGRELEALFNHELGGSPHYTPEGFANHAQSQQDSDYAEYLGKQDAIDSGLDRLIDHAQDFVHDMVFTDKTEDAAVDAFLHGLEKQNVGQANNIITGKTERDSGPAGKNPGGAALASDQSRHRIETETGRTDGRGQQAASVVEGYEDGYYPPSMTVGAAGGIGPVHAQAAVDSFMAQLPGAGSLAVSVVQHVRDIPEGVKPSGMAEGVYYPADGGGRIYLVADNLRSMDRMHQVLLHEVIGHFGVESLLGDGFTDVLSDVRRIARIPDGARVTGRERPGDKYYATMESVALSYPDYSSVNQAREVLARMAESNDRPVFLRSLYNSIRAALRAMGLHLQLTNDDLRRMVIDAGKYLRNTPAQKAHANMLKAAASMAASESGDAKSSKALPEAVIGHALGQLRNHPDYEAAKSGNARVAFKIAKDLVTDEVIARINEKIGDREAVILPVSAIEGQGKNKIPLMVAKYLGKKTGRTVVLNIYQSLKASRTALNGLDRIFRRPQFDGPVQPGTSYFLVDDTLTQGGTFAALAQYIWRCKGNVVGVFALTGKHYSANLLLQPQTLQILRERYGDVELQFKAATGYGFDALTESEGRYLARYDSPDVIRARILAEKHNSASQGTTGGEEQQQPNPREPGESRSTSVTDTPLSLQPQTSQTLRERHGDTERQSRESGAGTGYGFDGRYHTGHGSSDESRDRRLAEGHAGIGSVLLRTDSASQGRRTGGEEEQRSNLRERHGDTERQSRESGAGTESSARYHTGHGSSDESRDRRLAEGHAGIGSAFRRTDGARRTGGEEEQRSNLRERHGDTERQSRESGAGTESSARYHTGHGSSDESRDRRLAEGHAGIGSALLRTEGASRRKTGSEEEQRSNLRERHGDTERQSRESGARTGYGFDARTESSARYHTGHGSSDESRARRLAEGHVGSGSAFRQTDQTDGRRTGSEEQQQPNPRQPSESRSTSITDTPAFKRWFGDSKVVDSNGKPLIVYHGSIADFDVFDRKADSIFYYGTGKGAGGIFFTEKASDVDYYVEGSRGMKPGANVIPAYLSIKNPVHISDFMDLRDQAVALKEAEAQGYDGALIGERQWVVFRPEQIKSATGNRGTFDAASQNITESRGVEDSQQDSGFDEPLQLPKREPIRARDFVATEKLAAAQKKTASTWLTTRGLQLPKVVQAIRRSGTVNISPDSPAVNAESRKQVTTEKSAIGSREYVATADLSMAKQVDNLLSGKTSQAATLGNPSPLLLAAGIPDKPLRITRNVIEKIAGGKHHLTVDQVKDLPRLLASPVMVFKSATQDGSFVVVVDADAPTDRGAIEPIVVAIKADGTVENLPANVVASAHGRSGFAGAVSRWVEDGLLIAAQKKTAAGWLSTRGLQLPKVIQAVRRSGTVNISPDSPAVNALKITNGRITTIAESLKQSSEDQQDLSLEEPLQLPKREPVRARDFVTTEKNAIGSREYVAGRKLYERTADLSRAILSKLPAQIMFADNQSHAFKKMMRQLQIDQNKAVENAKRIAESGQTITPAERVMLSDMIEKQLAVADVPPDHIAELAAGIQSTLKIQAEKLVELGMLSEDRLIENYLPRLYRNPLAARLFSPEMMRSWYARARMKIGGARLQSRGLIDKVPLGKVDRYRKLGWKVSTLADGTGAPADLLEALDKGESIPEAYRAPGFKVLMWRDYTKEERLKMGEVRDGVLRYALGYVETQKDIAIGRLFKAIASHSGLASAVNPGGWIKIPEDNVKGSPGVKQYGALAGMFVPRDVSDALKRNTQPKGLLMAAYDRALSFWKEGKTVWNPVAHGNNVVSNLFVMHFAGLNPANPRHYRDAIREFKNRGVYWNEAVDHGLFGTEFANSELRIMLLPDLEDMVDIETVAASRVTKMTDFLAKYPGRPISWYRTNMQKAYEFEDQFFKLMIFMDRRKKGMGIDDAIVDSERYIFNYADVPEGVQNLKRWYSPFFSYTYKVLPMLLHTAMTRPDRMLAPMMLLGGANWLAYAYLGADEDDERKGLPEWMAGNTALGVPKSLRMPFDVDGKPAFMDISRRVPGGDLFDAQNQTGGVPIAAPFMPSHPVFSLVAALFLNKDTFTGDDLIKKSDTPWEASGKRAGYVYRQLMPNAPLLPGSYSFDKLMNGAAYEFDTQFLGYTGRTGSGDPTPIGLAMADTLSGTRIRVTDPKRGIDYKVGDIQRDMREINANIRSAARDKSKTVGNRNAYIAGEREKQRRLIDRLRELRH